MARRTQLDVFFKPRSVAVIGATETPATVGGVLMANLTRGFRGSIFPVNPKHSSILGLKSYARVGELAGEVELALVVTPAASVPGVIAECAEAGVAGAVIISAGFREVGSAEGIALEQQILDQARRTGMRIVGPNCLGVMSPPNGLNATFANAMAHPGNVGFISQSGALCTAILDWSLREMVGFSAFVSVGSMIDVGWGELIQYLGDDPHTRSIVIYMESVGEARSFLSAAREVALSKPIIVIKPGRTEAAARAAASHTGALTGSDEVLDAAFRRCGVLRVDRIADLFYLSEALGKQPRPRGPRLTIVTNAGGPGVLATDALLSAGGQLAELPSQTLDYLNSFLRPHWSHHNPIDILGDAGPQQYAQAVEAAVKNPESDGTLVILAPQGITDPAIVAEHLKPFAKAEGKPILASWMGGASVAAGESVLNGAGIPTFAYPDSAAQVFHAMWRYTDNLRALYETPSGGESTDTAGLERAERILAGARSLGRTLLTEAESKELLAAYRIPTVETAVAQDEDGAVAHANRIGYPVVVKLHSATVTHKTEVGGVRLNLAGEASVRAAYRGIQAAVRPADFLGVTVQPMIQDEGYELILGSSVDSQFGPVLLFGTGGRLVEVFKDRSLGLPPLNTTLARRMMERTKIFTALCGVRGRKPVDLAALEQLVVRFSHLAAEQRWIKEIEINPLLVSSDRLVALDARVVLHPPGTRSEDLPKTAIRPYPVQYEQPWRLEDGREILIRPVRPEDEPRMVRFHGTLSEHSVYLRYFHLMNLDQRVAHERLARICFIDYDREMVLVAQLGDGILAVGRLTRARQGNEAELAVLISDSMQGHGLGTELFRRLIEIGRAEGLDRLTAETLPENDHMMRICRQLGFTLHYSVDDHVITADLSLTSA